MREATAYEDASDCIRDKVEEVEAPPGNMIHVRVSLGESCGLGRSISGQFTMARTRHGQEALDSMQRVEGGLTWPYCDNSQRREHASKPQFVVFPISAYPSPSKHLIGVFHHLSLCSHRILRSARPHLAILQEPLALGRSWLNLEE